MMYNLLCKKTNLTIKYEGMKMKKLLSIALLTLAPFTWAAETTVEFSGIEQTSSTTTSDQFGQEYGETISQDSVTISTKNLQVDRFWHKFKQGNGNDKLGVDIDTKVYFDLITQTTFLCKKYGLPEEGCSGQKPFLVNEGTFDPNNADITVDRDGNALPTGEYRIPFDKAPNYNPSNQDAFYALDVLRDGKYYNESQTGSGGSSGSKSFLALLISYLQNYFSLQTTDISSSGLTPQESEKRNIYIANIFYGLQNAYKMHYGNDATSVSQTINSAGENRVSLLDYQSSTGTLEEGCDGLIFNYQPNSFTCRFMNLFQITEWFPFVDNVSTYHIESTSVQEDTEATLLHLAGLADGVDYLGQLDTLKNNFDPNDKPGFFQQIFKPVTFMIKGMTRFFFGSGPTRLQDAYSYTFDFNNPILLTFAVAKNGEIVGFKHFELTGLESVFGSETTTCVVKRKLFDGSFAKNLTAKYNGSTWSRGQEKTFIEGVDSSTYMREYIGGFGFGITLSEETYTTDDWLPWCANTTRNKSLIGNAISNNLFTDFLTGDFKLDVEQYFDVVTYTEKVHKGLVLHLKEVDSDNITVGTQNTTTRILMKKIERSGKTK